MRRLLFAFSSRNKHRLCRLDTVCGKIGAGLFFFLCLAFLLTIVSPFYGQVVRRYVFWDSQCVLLGNCTGDGNYVDSATSRPRNTGEQYGVCLGLGLAWLIVTVIAALFLYMLGVCVAACTRRTRGECCSALYPEFEPPTQDLGAAPDPDSFSE